MCTSRENKKSKKKGDVEAMSDERNGNINNEELIKELRAIIHAESSKPASEMDADLVAECVDYLMELENHRRLTEEEIDGEIEKIFAKTKKTRKTHPRFKALLIAACIAILVLSVNIFAMACGTDAISLLREFGSRIVEMLDGEKAVADDKELVNIGDRTVYDSLEEFLQNETISVLHPTKLPNNTKIVNISLTASFVNGTYNAVYKDVIYTTDNPRLSLSVRTNPDYIKGFLSDPNAEIKIVNGYECYIIQLETSVQCFFVYNNNVYVVNAPTFEDAELIINNLREGTPQ